jgi:hypothetical protein
MLSARLLSRVGRAVTEKPKDLSFWPRLLKLEISAHYATSSLEADMSEANEQGLTSAYR